MANFNTHFTVAAGASAVVSATLLSMEVVTPEQAVIAFGLVRWVDSYPMSTRLTLLPSK